MNIDYVQPACLPIEDDSDPVNESVTLIGWGMYDDTNTYSSVLKSYDEYIIPWSKCQQMAGVGNFSDDSIICSLFSNGRYYHVIYRKIRFKKKKWISISL